MHSSQSGHPTVKPWLHSAFGIIVHYRAVLVFHCMKIAVVIGKGRCKRKRFYFPRSKPLSLEVGILVVDEADFPRSTRCRLLFISPLTIATMSLSTQLMDCFQKRQLIMSLLVKAIARNGKKALLLLSPYRSSFTFPLAKVYCRMV